MTTDGYQPPPPPPRLAGVLLVVPAVIALVFAYVLPTVSTVLSSFRASSAFRERNEWVGAENYQQILGQGLGRSVGFALSIGTLPALLAILVALPLALAAQHAGRATRWVTRAVLALPLAIVTPTGLVGAWVLANRERLTGDDVAGMIRTAVFATTGGLALAVGVTLYLAALRQEPGRSPWPATALVGGLAAIVALALTLQQYAIPFVLGGDRGDRSDGATATPLLMMSQVGFGTGRFGRASAVATLLLAALAALGVLATVLVIATRSRLEVGRAAERPAGWPTSRVVAVAGAAVGIVVVLILTGSAVLPWLQRLGGEPVSGSAGVNPTRTLLYTWGPPLLSTVVGVAVALAAAIGIGALRPFGRASEWLLLPFAPWLLVGFGPFMLQFFESSVRSGQVDSWLALVPRTWVVIPALLVLTMLLRGQRARWDRLRAASQPASIRSTFVWPVLPMVALLAGVNWLVQSQDLLRQLVASPTVTTGPAAVVNQLLAAAYRSSWNINVSLALPPVLAVLFVLAAVALQLGYLDRLALRVGTDPPPPAMAATPVAVPVDVGVRGGEQEHPPDETAGP
jgi:ABC-type sugar transport system permease subunit